MALLLSGIVCSHGVHADSDRGHLVTGAAVSVSVSPEGHGSSHPIEHCVTAPPQQGPVLTPPCSVVSVGESPALRRALAGQGLNEPVPSTASPTALRPSVIQQV
jgi:hypothetical protein